MKKTKFMILFLTLIILSGCGKEEMPSNQFDYDLYEFPGIDYNTQNSTDYKREVVLIKDYDSYAEYVSAYTNNIWNKEFEADLFGYSEDFFEQNMLIVLLHWESTSSAKVSLHDIVYEDSNIEVILKSVYPYGTTDLEMDCALIIRIPRDDTYSTIEYSVIEEYEKKWYEF